MTDCPCANCSHGVPVDDGYKCRAGYSPSWASRSGSCAGFKKRTRPYKARTNFGHDGLVKTAIAWLRTMHCGKYLKEDGWGISAHSIIVSELVGCATEIPDAIGFNAPNVTLIECKQSRSDFMADQTKPSRIPYGASCMGNRRYYLTPEGMLKPEEIPGVWGLLESTSRGVVVVKPAVVVTDDTRARDDEMRLLESVIRRVKPENPRGLSVRWYTDWPVDKKPQARAVVEQEEGSEVG